jgi:hypothetical protein
MIPGEFSNMSLTLFQLIIATYLVYLFFYLLLPKSTFYIKTTKPISILFHWWFTPWWFSSSLPFCNSAGKFQFLVFVIMLSGSCDHTFCLLICSIITVNHILLYKYFIYYWQHVKLKNVLLYLKTDGFLCIVINAQQKFSIRDSPVFLYSYLDFYQFH